MPNYVSRYSLADHIVTIVGVAPGIGGQIKIQIGGPGENGEGSCVGEIKVTRNADLWSTEADPTGSWVHNRNMDKSGRIDINIRQVSDNVIRLIKLCSCYENITADAPGLTITVSNAMNSTSNPQVTSVDAEDCFPVKVSDQVYGNVAAEQPWSFTCGRILFNTNVDLGED